MGIDCAIMGLQTRNEEEGKKRGNEAGSTGALGEKGTPGKKARRNKKRGSGE